MSATLTASEKEREDRVRTLVCPGCGAKPRERCGSLWAVTSHTGRYLAAVDAGLVPEFAGGWRG